MPRVRRYRVDREAITALCAIWWQAEHGEAPPWPLSNPGVLEAPTAQWVRLLIKQQRPETPGDLAVLEALPEQETQSAARLKSVFEAERWARGQATPVLLRALEMARGNEATTLVSGGSELVPGRHAHGLVLPLQLLKAVLATREHVPNMVERKQKRVAAASQRRGERPPRSRR